MSDFLRPWYRRPIAIVGMLCGGVVTAWLGYAVWLTVQNIQFMRRGQDLPALAQQKQFQATLSKAFSRRPLTSSVDLTRLAPRGGEPTLGNPNASVRIIEFVDYDCPFSKQVAPTIVDFMRRHADEVFFELRDFPLTDIHPDAEQVAIAARCVWNQGDQKRFWSFSERLFESQKEHSSAAVRLYAQQLGVDLPSFDACIASQQPLNAIRQSLEDGIAVDVMGTPTFFFNGVKIQGAIDPDSLEMIFEAAKRSPLPVYGTR